MGNKNPKISFCMIAKNEERWIGRCLASVRDLVDEMIVLDTGSTDQTVRLAESMDARVVPHVWKDDFSEAKNTAIRHASHEWILMLDADEALEQEDIPLVRELVKSTRFNAYSLVFLCPGPDQAVYRYRTMRLFRRGKVHFEDIVHERPIIEGLAGISAVRVHHYGFNLEPEVMARKQKRNESLLRKQIQQNPENTFARANLVRSLRIQKQIDAMIREAESTLDIPDIPLFDRQLIGNDLAYGYLITNQLDKADRACQSMLADNPLHLDVRFILGAVRIRQNRLDEAIACFRQFLSDRDSDKEQPELEGLIFDTYGYASRAWNNIGSCYLNTKRPQEAVEAFRRALELEQGNLLFYKNLAGACLQNQHPGEALQVLRRAEILGIADDVVYQSIKALTNAA